MEVQKVVKNEVLVVGTGIAGCAAALSLAKNGIRVLLVSKDKDINKSSTNLAQGGIIARGENDTAVKLIRDILEAGDGLCKLEAATILANEGPDMVQKILVERAGVKFSKVGGRLDFTKEAAHSENRILHKNDHTGAEIENKLTQLVARNENITLINNHTLIDLLIFPGSAKDKREAYSEPRCVGAKLLDNLTRKVNIVLCKNVVLATGGIGQVYIRTTNPEMATGDGLAAASRAGAQIINAEYLQFHPTSLVSKEIDTFLISESVRGEGAELINEKGELFMNKYDKRGSLAPRDIVARGVYEEILKSKGGCAYLDMKSYMNTDFIRKRFPLIYETCLEHGIDATREPIPIAPSAHYFCGGIKVDAKGRSTLKNLYAAGEVSCTGLHGANRLASTSLLEGLVWGTRCGADIAENIKAIEMVDIGELLPESDMGTQEIDMVQIDQDWMNIKLTMWNSVGIVRKAKDLEKAVMDLEYLKDRIGKYYADARICRKLSELRNGVETALIIAKAARDNKESRGCHFRKD